MLITVLVIVAAACGLAMMASVVMTWASHRSAVWSMLLGGVLALAVLAGAVIIALLLTRAAYPQ
jgi:hypothetical protein